MATLPQQGVLRVVPPAQLEQSLRAEAEANVAATRAAQAGPELSQLAGYVRNQFDQFQRHRNDAKSGWSERMLSALRTFNGIYDATKLMEIRKFGGSEVYARIVAMKCRGANALLRDVYLAPERPWAIEAPADPDVPPEIIQNILQLVKIELASFEMQAAQQAASPTPPPAPTPPPQAMQVGQPTPDSANPGASNNAGGAVANVPPLAPPPTPPDAGMIRDRVNFLMEAARTAEKKNARKRAEIAQDKIEEILDSGGFYKALSEALQDIPLFPFACVKGPIVRIVPDVAWQGNTPVVTQQPRLFWERISPLDVYFTPGVSDIESANVIERVRFTRAELNDLLDLPGYDQAAVRSVLQEYGNSGLVSNQDTTDNERAVHERRENPQTNYSGMIDGLEFHGNVQGQMLLDQGVDPEQIPDPDRDYMVQLWLIGNYIIKVQITPSPRKRHPYFVSSFEKVPGTPVGNALPDILADIQEVANATLRSLVNNMSIASGPQVEISMNRIAPGENADDIYPWKRWHTLSDPMDNTNQPAIRFFQPNSNAQELLGVYKELNIIADDISAIPKYMSGGGATGGAGRTASGLAMLMGNASKILQTVAANIDRDIMFPALQQLFDMLMLTDQTGALRGDEHIRVMGVNVAVQRETQRARQLEFLSITANPLDAQILGTQGRAKVLRTVSNTIGMDGEDIVPPDDELQQIEQKQKALLEQQAAEAQGSQPGSTTTGDSGPRTNISRGAGPVGGGAG